jgi:hypothetical protein
LWLSAVKVEMKRAGKANHAKKDRDGATSFFIQRHTEREGLHDPGSVVRSYYCSYVRNDACLRQGVRTTEVRTYGRRDVIGAFGLLLLVGLPDLCLAASGAILK